MSDDKCPNCQDYLRDCRCCDECGARDADCDCE